MIAHDLIGYDGPDWIRVVGGRAVYETVLVKDGYQGGNVRLVRLELDRHASLHQVNRYVHPDTPVELVPAWAEPSRRMP